MFCFWTAYVAGSAVLNLQKNDAKYEASVLQQSGFLAYSRTESSATEWSFKLNKDSSIRSENCGGVEYNRIYSSMKMSAACCTGRRGLGPGFMAGSYEARAIWVPGMHTLDNGHHPIVSGLELHFPHLMLIADTFYTNILNPYFVQYKVHHRVQIHRMCQHYKHKILVHGWDENSCVQYIHSTAYAGVVYNYVLFNKVINL